MNKISRLIYKLKIKKFSPFYVLFFILLSLYTLSLLLPMIWGLFSSLKSVGEFRLNYLGLPKEFAWENYPFVFEKFNVKILGTSGMMKEIGMFEQLFNTVLYVLGCSFVVSLIPCIMAYLNVKFNFKFNSVIRAIVLITLMLPIVGSLPSQIQILKGLMLYDSIIGMWIREASFLGIYFFVFCASFKGISKEFSEAAYVDGASEWVTMTRIMLPLVKITFFTVMLIKGIYYWNDFETPRLFLPSHPTLAYGILNMAFTADNQFNNVPMRMTSCFILMIPIFVLFVAFNNKLMGNISMGGVKE